MVEPTNGSPTWATGPGQKKFNLIQNSNLIQNDKQWIVRDS